MDYNTEQKKEYEEGLSFDTVLLYTKKVLEKWHIVVLTGLVCAIIGLAIAFLTYTDKYSSQIMLIASNKSSALAAAVQSQSDFNASASLASSIKDVSSAFGVGRNWSHSVLAVHSPPKRHIIFGSLPHNINTIRIFFAKR